MHLPLFDKYSPFYIETKGCATKWTPEYLALYASQNMIVPLYCGLTYIVLNESLQELRH